MVARIEQQVRQGQSVNLQTQPCQQAVALDLEFLVLATREDLIVKH
jgi:hypothetical protein